jgi:hypothetical protein
LSMKYENCFHSQQELQSRERTSCPTCIVVLIVESALCRHGLFNSALSSLKDILPNLYSNVRWKIKFP